MLRPGRVRLGLASLVAGLLLALGPATAWGGFDTFVYTVGPVAIPDGHGAAKLHFDFTAPPGASITSARPNFRVHHRRTGQLRLYVRGPDRTKVLLDDRETHGRNLGELPCGGDPNGLGYTGFWDLAFGGQTLADGSPPYTGYFVPHDPLSVFNGQSYGGRWTVIVKDTQAGTSGELLCGLMDIQYIIET
jgi:hypothetical protein